MTNKTARTTTASELRLQVDAALAKVNQRQNLLISGGELWDRDPQLEQELEPCWGYVQALIDLGDVRTCPNPGLHRQDWRYLGNNRYLCGVCARLLQEVSR